VCEVEVFERGAVVCGDGKREGGEECDDGNYYDMDGCSGICRVEKGWKCGPVPGGGGIDACNGVMCLQSCPTNGVCEDGGPGSSASYCIYGHDCSDCGPRCAGKDQVPSKWPGSFKVQPDPNWHSWKTRSSSNGFLNHQGEYSCA
jgi:cysteine-rich repeat protein